jgi:U5 small nuclear ribonucleoprotein component
MLPPVCKELTYTRHVISGIDPDPELRLSPENGNVAFASTDMGWCFTLRSFAEMYAERYGECTQMFFWNLSHIVPKGPVDTASFAERMWGDVYFSKDTRRFTRKAADPESRRSFVEFVLEPLYKLYSHVLSEEMEQLKGTLESLGIFLKPVMYKMDVRPLLKAVLDQFFGPATGLVDMIVDHIPNPIEAAVNKVKYFRLCHPHHLHISRSKGPIQAPCHLTSQRR